MNKEWPDFDMAELQAWKPSFDHWRHGGWYVTNISYPSGAAGCVSNNYPDKKWRVACSDQTGTFATRTEAALAERGMVLAFYLNTLARRLDEAAICSTDNELASSLRAMRDFALKGLS